MSIFGPRVNITEDSLHFKLAENFLVKIKVLNLVGLNLSVFFLPSFIRTSPELDRSLSSMMDNYNEFKEYTLEKKIDFLSKNYQRFKNTTNIGYSKENKNIPLILEKIYSKLKGFKIGICLFYIESYDSSLKVLKFCKNDAECKLFFFQILNSEKQKNKIFFLIPRRSYTPLNLIENKIYRSNRFIHDCGKSLSKIELILKNRNCSQCKMDLSLHSQYYLTQCDHGIRYKLKCGHGCCYDCIDIYNGQCRLCNNILDASDRALMSVAVVNDGRKKCNMCRNLNYTSASKPDSCTDCYYENAIMGRI